MAGTYHIAGPGKIVPSADEWFPHINWVNPPEEREAARNLDLQLLMLRHQETQFLSALELLYHVGGTIAFMKTSGLPEHELGERARVARWTNIAGTYAAISLSNFRDALFSIRHAVGQCPTRKVKVDTETLDVMPARFLEAFPNHKELRDGAVHFVDKIFSTEKIDANRATDAPFIHGAMDGDTLVFTVEGKHVGLDVTLETLEKIAALRREALECFRKLSVR